MTSCVAFVRFFSKRFWDVFFLVRLSVLPWGRQTLGGGGVVVSLCSFLDVHFCVVFGCFFCVVPEFFFRVIWGRCGMSPCVVFG